MRQVKRIITVEHPKEIELQAVNCRSRRAIIVAVSSTTTGAVWTNFDT